MVCALLAGALAVVFRLASQSAPETNVRTISLARVVRIPLTSLSSQETGRSAPNDANTLMVSTGGPDEPPVGTAAFDVFDDGSFLIADPLRKRLAIFDGKGKFQRELIIGFAADDVTIMPNGLIQVRDSRSGDTVLFDRQGQQRSSEGAAPPQIGEARLLSGKSGAVTRPSAGGGGSLQVQFDKIGLRLLSIESLATDREGNTYVALEATAGSDVVDVSKYVRKYAANGKLLAEVADIPLGYYILPVNEFRIRNDTLYQLMTTRSEVQMNEWDWK